jgi:hypothetical protein
LKPLIEASGFHKTYISNLVAARVRPGRERALELEKAAREIGRNIPAPLWLFGSRDELRAALLGERADGVCQ